MKVVRAVYQKVLIVGMKRVFKIDYIIYKSLTIKYLCYDLLNDILSFRPEAPEFGLPTRFGGAFPSFTMCLSRYLSSSIRLK